MYPSIDYISGNKSRIKQIEVTIDRANPDEQPVLLFSHSLIFMDVAGL